MAATRETGQVPDDVPAALASLYPPYLGKYWQSVLNFEGAAWTTRFPGPVLVLSGEKDANHVVAKETAALAEGLKKRLPDDHEVYIVPGASHNLKPLDPGLTGVMAAEAADKLRSWLRKILGAGWGRK
jgi:pimeloyl-ACP methyl ester carboxylesterase